MMIGLGLPTVQPGFGVPPMCFTHDGRQGHFTVDEAGIIGCYAGRGLGQMYKQTSDGTVVDCDLLENLTYGVCWNPWAPQAPSAAVPSMHSVPQPVPPPPPVPTPDNLNPLVLPPSSGAAADATVTGTLAQQLQNNQAALNQYIQDMQNQGVPQACTMNLLPTIGICDSVVYIGAGIAALVLIVFLKK